VLLSNGTLFSKHVVQYKNAPERTPKWVYWLSSKWVLASDRSVRSWLVQPINELSPAAGLCAGRGCALIRQLAYWFGLIWPVAVTGIYLQVRRLTTYRVEWPPRACTRHT